MVFKISKDILGMGLLILLLSSLMMISLGILESERLLMSVI